MRKCLLIFILLIGLSPTTHAQSVEKPDLTWLLQTNQAKSLRYWFDNEMNVKETEGISNHYTLDASSLLDGLHTIHFQIVDIKGNVGNIASNIFFKIQEEKEAEEVSIVKVIYWFDNEKDTNELDLDGSGQLIDVSHLEEGVHTIHCQAIFNNGQITPVVSSVFIYVNVVDLDNRITKYNYWINDNTIDKKTVELVNAPNPYKLQDLLPVREEPIRSYSFHFETFNNQPMIYAKNDFHVRFHDLRGYFVDESIPFIDYRVGRPVEIIEWLVSGESKTIDKPNKNDIKWYQLEAVPGDSLQFKLDRAATIQLFSPSGQEIYGVSGSESLKWAGLHVWEEGTFYLALHDVTATKGTTISIDYNHIDKYAVLRQDISVVGNGGCSTITFKGNGFRDLYRVDLYTAEGDSIHSLDISHDSDAETAVTFDFSGAALGVYGAVFHFTEEDKHFGNIVTVEEATELEFDISATFATQFLRGTTNRYTFKIHNKSNMTAYHVPLPIHIYAPDSVTLTSVEVGGYSVKNRLKDLLKSNYTDSLDAFIINSMKTTKDMYYFLRDASTDYVNGFPYLYHGFICPDIRPNTTETFTVSITTVGTLHVYMWCPSKEFSTNQSGQKLVNRSRTVIDDFNCGRATEHARQCEDNQRMIDLGIDPIYNVDCPSNSSSGVCPGGGAGGSSTPQPPSDPNDIYGYLSEAGSKFMTDEVAKVNYTIEFENDTTFAQASAHTIVIRDTLDSRYFDLKSFLPTSVKIGEREAFLDEAMDIKKSGSVTSFLKTIDMRPEINAIAQVEGEYSQQTGIAKWIFTSLDPMTMEPTDDLMQGILPINYNGTSGIGEVMFEVGVKPNKGDGTQIPNRASIVFDYEESILTPTWTNIVDAIAPESHVSNVKMLNDSTATVSIEATDELSGPWRYNVYVQYDDGAWFLGAENVPIDKAASVKVYEGINHGFYTIVTDSAGNVEQKEAQREFTFEVFAPQTETSTKIQLAEGWNWISQNQNTALSAEAVKPKAQRIKSQTEELYKDTRFGWTGDLDELQPTAMYKVQAPEAGEIQLSGLLFNAAFRSIPLREGWNWIGYPVAMTMAPAEALAKLEAEEDDAIIGQGGMATYSGGQWTGTLTELQPGQGYMFRSMSNKSLFLNATAQASSRKVGGVQSVVAPQYPDNWTVDKRKYPNVMGMVAELMQDGEPVGDHDEWLLAAFCGNECRGLAQTVAGRLMMNVYGQGGEKITFLVMHRESGEILSVSESEEFGAGLIGSVRQPRQLNMGMVTGIVSLDNERLSNNDDVYDLQGRKVDAGQSQKGVYIVTDSKNGETQKVVRK